MRATNTASTPSRADLLRERRAQQSHTKSSYTRKPSSRAVKSQPVTVRSYHASAAVPLNRPKTNRVRKQFYYTLGASGAELRLPAMPLVDLGPRLVSGALFLLTAVAIYILAFSSRFQVGTYPVTGLQRVDHSAVEAVLKLEGSQIILLDPQTVVHELNAAFPELTNIALHVGFPAKLAISVTELQPVLSWKVGDTDYWLDKDGIILPPRGQVDNLEEVASPDLPPLVAIAGDTPAASGDTTAVTAATTTAADSSTTTPTTYWGRQVDPQFMNAIISLPKIIPQQTNLVYNSQNGLGWKDPGGWDVYIGRDLTNIDQKLAIYQTIIDGLQKQGITPTQMVSLAYIDAPYYK